MAGQEKLPKSLQDIDGLTAFAADRLRDQARIAAFSLSGWDTHRQQAGNLGPSLSGLQRLVLGLQSQLGPVWDQTLLAMTEFERTRLPKMARGAPIMARGARC